MGNSATYEWLTFQIHRLTHRGVLVRRGMGITGAEYWITWICEIFCRRFGRPQTRLMLIEEKRALQRLIRSLARREGYSEQVPLSQLAPAFFGEDFCNHCGGRGYHQVTCHLYVGPGPGDADDSSRQGRLQERPRRLGFPYACVTCGRYDVQWLHEDDTQCIDCIREQYEADRAQLPHPDPIGSLANVFGVFQQQALSLGGTSSSSSSSTQLPSSYKQPLLHQPPLL